MAFEGQCACLQNCTLDDDLGRCVGLGPLDPAKSESLAWLEAAEATAK